MSENPDLDALRATADRRHAEHQTYRAAARPRMAEIKDEMAAHPRGPRDAYDRAEQAAASEAEAHQRLRAEPGNPRLVAAYDPAPAALRAAEEEAYRVSRAARTAMTVVPAASPEITTQAPARGRAFREAQDASLAALTPVGVQ